MRDAPVLITGGAGFIGKQLVLSLIAQGRAVRVLDSLSPQVHGPGAVKPAFLDHSLVEFIHDSVTSPAVWHAALADVGAVVHLAAETGTGQSMYEIARYNEVNSQGTALLFDCIAKTRPSQLRSILLASSRSVYGEGAYECTNCGGGRVFPDTRKLADLKNGIWEPLCSHCGNALTAIATSESDRTKPASIYAATKLAQEDLVRVACEALGLKYTIFRFQNVYGEGQSLNNPYTGILSIFSTRIRRGLDLPLFEDGKESRDFVHVDDVVRAVGAALDHPGELNDVINVGSGVATSVREVAQRLFFAFGVQPVVRVTGEFRLGDIRHCFADVEKMRQLLGVSPRIELGDGLSRFARWVESQPLPEDQLDSALREMQSRQLMHQATS